MEKFPFASVIEDARVPFMETVAAGTAVPFASFTVPRICFCCAWATVTHNDRNKVSRMGATRKNSNRWLSIRIIAINLLF
jgi:hypothetical protein